MDISKYRDNTELSDICVVIEDHEFNLHKFPLSINCEYFKNECKNQSKVTFKQFPGGKRNFEIIADHCYGKDVELTVENVASVFCSSEFLGMGGKNNLIEKCEKFIDRIFRSSEFSHSIEGVIELLQSCLLVKDDKLNGFVDRGLSIIIQIWLRPLSGYKSNLKEKYIEDSFVFETILKLNSFWIKEIIKCCSVDESKFPFIAKLVVFYLEDQLFYTENETKFENSQSNSIPNEKSSTRRASSSSLSSNEDIKEIKSEKDSTKDSEKLIKNLTTENRRDIFDNVIAVLPDDITLGKIVTIDWLQKAMKFCEKYDNKMKNKLLQLCSGLLTHASVNDLKSMDPKNVTEIIEQTMNNDTIDPELMTWIWDHHFLQMAQNSELNPALFNKVVKNMSESQKVDSNVIFKIVLSILNNTGSDGNKYKEELITSVDLDQISPENLEEALESKLWDNEVICKVAIKRLKDRSFNKSENVYSTKDSKSNFDQPYIGNDSKTSTSFKSHLYTTHLSPYSSLYDEDIYTTYPEIAPTYYPISKYKYSTYFPDTYLTLEENLKYELKRISDSYTNYNKKRLRSRSRRTQVIAHQCPI